MAYLGDRTGEQGGVLNLPAVTQTLMGEQRPPMPTGFLSLLS